MLADPPHLSRHQSTTSTPPLSSSCFSHRSARLKTSNPSYHRNQQYSIIGLTNAAGTLVERYSYTAYGTLGIYDPSGTVRTTSTYANRYTYTGREYDPDLNLYHFRARWYDPATGGFISRDPLGYVDGMSMYRGYFGVQGRDYSGTWNCKVGDCVIEAKMTKVRLRLVGITPNGGEEFDTDPIDFYGDDIEDDDVFDPDTMADITEALLKQLLKKLLARIGGGSLLHRLTNLFPSGDYLAQLDRINLQVGLDVDCTRKNCVETTFLFRKNFDFWCWYHDLGLKAPDSVWEYSNHDCGGPYWVTVDTLDASGSDQRGNYGDGEYSTVEEIREMIRRRDWKIQDPLSWSKVILKMKQLDHIPAGCSVVNVGDPEQNLGQ